MKDALSIDNYGDDIVETARLVYEVCFLLPKFYLFACYFVLYFPYFLKKFILICIVKISLEWNFTRGLRSELVQAACLYLACR